MNIRTRLEKLEKWKNMGEYRVFVHVWNFGTGKAEILLVSGTGDSNSFYEAESFREWAIADGMSEIEINQKLKELGW